MVYFFFSVALNDTRNRGLNLSNGNHSAMVPLPWQFKNFMCEMLSYLHVGTGNTSPAMVFQLKSIKDLIFAQHIHPMKLKFNWIV